MSSRFLQNLVVVTLATALFTVAVFACRGAWLFAFGTLAGVCWAFLNAAVLVQIIRMAATVKQVDRKLAVLLVVKFPVIYLTGFFILRTNFFPVTSLVTGLTIVFAAFAFSWFKSSKTAVAMLIGAFWSVAAFAMEAAEHGAEAAHEAAEHGSAHGGEHGGGAMHTSNFVTVIARFLPESSAKALLGLENVIFCIIVISILGLIFYAASRKMSFVPSRLQSGCEAVVSGLNNFVCGIIGPEGKKYTPFLGTLFLYILTMNLLGLLPLMKSNTANSITLAGPIQIPIPTTTVALALIVFVFVQCIGIKNQGLLGYLDHMAGSPRDAFGWAMAPLMFPIHLIGELAKPFSLTFRLFCNIMGGHVLVAVFIGMGIATMFIPFQAPFLLFEIVTSTIQALVFTLLSTVYIAMMLPHHDHGEEHAAQDAHAENTHEVKAH